MWAAAWQNQQNDLCVQRRLWSAWASAVHSVGSWGPNVSSCGQGRLIRLGAHVILLVLLRGGSCICSTKSQQTYQQIRRKQNIWSCFFLCEYPFLWYISFLAFCGVVQGGIETIFSLYHYQWIVMNIAKFQYNLDSIFYSKQNNRVHAILTL